MSPAGFATPGENITLPYTDIEVCSGVLHVIDTVLVPNFPGGAPAPEPEEEPLVIPDDSIAGVAIGVDDLSTLVEYVVYAGFAELLADPSSEFTVFAPVNSGWDFINGLFNSTCAVCGPPEGPPVPGVQEVLSYHVIPTGTCSRRHEERGTQVSRPGKIRDPRL